eukprot:COSAG05_NODE_3074_length_2351_cov_20.743783_1_plen_165_part_00
MGTSIQNCLIFVSWDMRQSLYARSHTFSREFVFTVPKFLVFCLYLFAVKYSVGYINWAKISSGFFWCMFVDWIFRYKTVDAVFSTTMPGWVPLFQPAYYHMLNFWFRLPRSRLWTVPDLHFRAWQNTVSLPASKFARRTCKILSVTPLESLLQPKPQVVSIIGI